MSGVIQRLHSSPTLTNKLVTTYKSIDDFNAKVTEEPTRSMLRPVYRYATYNPKEDNSQSIYEGMKVDYQYIDDNIVDVNGRNGYVPNYLMVAGFLPLVYSLFPNDFQLIIAELNVNIIDFTNNSVEAKSLILNDKFCFYRQQYRQRVFDLYTKMYDSFPEAGLPSSDFCCAVCEVFPNKELTGGHAVTLLKSAKGELFIIDDQSRINPIGTYVKQHQGHIYEISIKDIDGTTIANVNSAVQASCTEDPTGNFNARVTRFVLHIGNEGSSTDFDATPSVNTGLSGGNSTSSKMPGIIDKLKSLDKKILYAGIGVGVLLIVGIIVAVVMILRKKSSANADTEQSADTEEELSVDVDVETDATSTTEMSDVPEGVTIDVGGSNDVSEGTPSVATSNDTAANATTNSDVGVDKTTDATSNSTTDKVNERESKSETEVTVETVADEIYFKHAKELISKIRPNFTEMSECLDALEKNGIDTKIKVDEVGVFSGMVDTNGQEYTMPLPEVCKNPPKEFQISVTKTTKTSSNDVTDSTESSAPPSETSSTETSPSGQINPTNEAAKEKESYKRRKPKKVIKLGQ